MAEIPSAQQEFVDGRRLITTSWFRYLEGLQTGGAGGGSATWNATTAELEYDNGQITLADSVGWNPKSYPLGGGATQAIGATIALPINGGSAAIPMVVVTHTRLQSISVVNNDAANTRAFEARLYRQYFNDGNASENTLAEVVGTNATDSFVSIGIPAVRTAVIAVPGTYLAPGIYWLVVRNTSATQTYGLAVTAAGALGGDTAQTKTLGTALGATLDFVAATWTKIQTIPITSLDGRVFGQTTAF